MSRQRVAEAALAFNTIIWGATFVLVQTALHDVSPILFLALRFGLATAALAVLFLPRAQKQFSWIALRSAALAGTFLFGGYLFQTLGLRLTSAPKSAFITGLASVMVPLLGSFVYRTRPQKSEWIGILLATVGLAMMTLEGDLRGVNLGDALTLLGAVSFACHVLALGRFSPKVGFELLSLTQVAVAGLWSVLLFRGVEQSYLLWRPAVLYAILITGLLCTALAFTLQAWAQRFTSSTRTALLYMLEPVVAWVMSYLTVGVGLSGRGAAGAALIFGGVLMVELKPWQVR